MPQANPSTLRTTTLDDFGRSVRNGTAAKRRLTIVARDRQAVCQDAAWLTTDPHNDGRVVLATKAFLRV